MQSISCESGVAAWRAQAHCDVNAGGARLLDDLEAQDGERPESAMCSGNLDGRPGNAIDCTIVAGPDTQAFTLTVGTVNGSKINYTYEPRP